MNNIEEILNKYNISNYSIREDGKVDVNDHVDLRSQKLTELPVRFGIITGDFLCSYNLLTTLDGSPEYVGRDFLCQTNKLTTLEGCTKRINGTLYVNNNPLITLTDVIKYSPLNYTDTPVLRFTQIISEEYYDLFDDCEVLSIQNDVVVFNVDLWEDFRKSINLNIGLGNLELHPMVSILPI